MTDDPAARGLGLVIATVPRLVELGAVRLACEVLRAPLASVVRGEGDPPRLPAEVEPALAALTAAGDPDLRRLVHAVLLRFGDPAHARAHLAAYLAAVDDAAPAPGEWLAVLVGALDRGADAGDLFARLRDRMGEDEAAALFTDAIVLHDARIPTGGEGALAAALATHRRIRGRSWWLTSLLVAIDPRCHRHLAGSALRPQPSPTTARLELATLGRPGALAAAVAAGELTEAEAALITTGVAELLALADEDARAARGARLLADLFGTIAPLHRLLTPPG